ncbi:MAG: ABC transporter substrate-binding protein [Anaerolineae bacterium]
MSRKLRLILTAAFLAVFAFSAIGISAQAQTVELRILWYNDGDEEKALRPLLDKFEAENPGIKVTLDVIAFADLHNILQANLDGGTPPDMASITELGRFQGRYLDLRPSLMDAADFEKKFGNTLNWLRVPGGEDNGIYGFPRTVTVSGPFINATLFEQAGVAIPEGDQTTWEEWIALATEVKEKTGVPYAVAIDRSGHRSFGPAMSYGATLLDPKTGKFTVDSPGFRAWAEVFQKWHTDNLTPAEVWIGGGGNYVAAKDYFVNGELVFYYSGGWQISAFTREIADNFEWRAVPQPCGPAACTGMPGGTMIVGFKDTKHPAEVAKVMEYMASDDVMREYHLNSLFATGNLNLIEAGIEYPVSTEAFNVFLNNLPKITEQAFQIQGHPLVSVINVEMRDQFGRWLAGEITLDEAIIRMQTKVDEACAAEPQKCVPLVK